MKWRKWQHTTYTSTSNSSMRAGVKSTATIAKWRVHWNSESIKTLIPLIVSQPQTLNYGFNFYFAFTTYTVVFILQMNKTSELWGYTFYLRFLHFTKTTDCTSNSCCSSCAETKKITNFKNYAINHEKITPDFIIVCIVYNLVVTVYGRLSFRGWGASNLIQISPFIWLSVCFCRSWKDLTQPRLRHVLVTSCRDLFNL